MPDRSIRKHGAVPSFKGYNGFPGSICISVNDELVHGIPGVRVLREGDIISVDIGAECEGYHGDRPGLIAVGRISEGQRLLRVTEESLYAVWPRRCPVLDWEISPMRSNAIGGRGLFDRPGIRRPWDRRELHEEPRFPNFGPPGRGPRLKPGMTLAVEPMVNEGSRVVRTLDDNWTVVTDDGSFCATLRAYRSPSPKRATRS